MFPPESGPVGLFRGGVGCADSISTGDTVFSPGGNRSDVLFFHICQGQRFKAEFLDMRQRGSVLFLCTSVVLFVFALRRHRCLSRFTWPCGFSVFPHILHSHS